MYINDLVSDIMIFLYNKREYICCHVTDSKMNFKVFTLKQRNHCYFTGTQSLKLIHVYVYNDALFFIINTLTLLLFTNAYMYMYVLQCELKTVNKNLLR